MSNIVVVNPVSIDPYVFFCSIFVESLSSFYLIEKCGLHWNTFDNRLIKHTSKPYLLPSSYKIVANKAAYQHLCRLQHAIINLLTFSPKYLRHRNSTPDHISVSKKQKTMTRRVQQQPNNHNIIVCYKNHIAINFNCCHPDAFKFQKYDTELKFDIRPSYIKSNSIHQ